MNPFCVMGKYKFKIYDTDDDEVLRVVSPCCCGLQCAVMCFQDVEFHIVDSDGDNIGVITKKVRSVLWEMLTDLDNFRADFPASLPVEHKVLLVACSLLIDKILFSKRGGGGDGD